MPQIDIAKALDEIAELIDAAINGEEVIITKDDLPVVKLMPISPPKKRRSPLFGSDKGLIAISDDFDEPLEEFREYM